MNASFTPGIETGKVLNLKYMLTILVIAVVVILVLQKVMKQTIVLTDKTGAETGRGEIKFSINGLKKKA
jgi:hypothetical protein